MDAIHDRLFGELQPAGGGHIGGDHEFFDDFVADEAFPFFNRSHVSVLVKADFDFGRFQLQRPASFAGQSQRLISFVKRRDRRFEKLFGPAVELAPDCRFRFFVSQPGGGLDDNPSEFPVKQVSRPVDLHETGDCRALDAGVERAKVVA